ncbi:MAG: hypothetical protein ABIG11_06980 [bacterium]
MLLMYRDFEILAVKDDIDLRDTARIRRLHRHNYLGLMIAGGAMAGSGIVFLLLSSWLGLAIKAGRSPLQDMPGTVLAVCFFITVVDLGMAAAFLRETWKSPLAGYLREPMAFDFMKARLTRADFLPAGRKSDGKMRISGEFGEKTIFMEEFRADIWSSAVAEQGENENLKPGDDRYHYKGKRLRLPLKAWVIYRRDNPAKAALVGLPAALVERLRSPHSRSV